MNSKLLTGISMIGLEFFGLIVLFIAKSVNWSQDRFIFKRRK